MENEINRESFYIIELTAPAPTSSNLSTSSSSSSTQRSLSIIGDNSMFYDNLSFISFCREKEWQFGDDQRNIYSTHMLLRTLVLKPEEQQINITSNSLDTPSTPIHETITSTESSITTNTHMTAASTKSSITTNTHMTAASTESNITTIIPTTKSSISYTNIHPFHFQPPKLVSPLGASWSKTPPVIDTNSNDCSIEPTFFTVHPPITCYATPHVLPLPLISPCGTSFLKHNSIVNFLPQFNTSYGERPRKRTRYV
jgi:hypothetical protein